MSTVAAEARQRAAEARERAAEAREQRAEAAKPAARPDLADDRVREIYSQYVEARRRQKETTPEPSFDAIARNLRESSARLREKHGKAVDFEVMVKDGKTFLRPVIK